MSRHGFKAIYKDGNLAAPAQRLLYSIIHGHPTIISGRSVEGILICVTPNTYRQYNPGYDPWTFCASNLLLASFYPVHTSWLFLCSRFLHEFKSEPEIPPGQLLNMHCPKVQNNVFVGDQSAFVNYQKFNLIQLLGLFYLQDLALTARTRPAATSDWNQCVGMPTLPANNSPCLRNVENLVIYVASEYYSFRVRWRDKWARLNGLDVVVVSQACLQAPDPFAPPFARGVALANGTAVGYHSSMANMLAFNSTDIVVDS